MTFYFWESMAIRRRSRRKRGLFDSMIGTGLEKPMPRGLVPPRECYQRGGTKYEIRLGRKIPRTLVLSKPGLPLYLRFARLGGWWWVLKVSEFLGYLFGLKYDIIYGVAEGTNHS